MCLFCYKKDEVFFSPDLDIKGIGVCKEHEEEGRTAYFILVNEGIERFDKYVSNCNRYKVCNCYVCNRELKRSKGVSHPICLNCKIKKQKEKHEKKQI
jgi:hypothetical protein